MNIQIGKEYKFKEEWYRVSEFNLNKNKKYFKQFI